MTLKIAAKTNLIHCRPTPTVACLCFWPKKGNIVLIQLKLQRKTFKVLCLAVHRTLLMYFCPVLKTSKCQSESSRVVSQNFQSCKKGIYLGVVEVLIVRWKCWHIPVAKVSLIGFGKIWNGFWQRIWLHFWGRADHTNFIVGIIPAASNLLRFSSNYISVYLVAYSVFPLLKICATSFRPKVKHEVVSWRITTWCIGVVSPVPA